MKQNPLQINNSKEGSRNILILISAVILSSIIVGGTIYLWQNSKVTSLYKESLNIQQSLKNQIVTLKESNNTLQLKLNKQKIEGFPGSSQNSDYKEFKMLYYASDSVTAEIPETWSVYKNPENLGENELLHTPTASIGSDDVEFGDLNWYQIDLHYTINNITQSLVEEAKKTNYGSTWSNTNISGINADVQTFPLDNGNVTKGGTGGKSYFLSLPDAYDVKTLVITKQAQGDEEFENGFEHFIETLTFKKE